MKRKILFLSMIVLLTGLFAYSQKVAVVSDTMPSFTLPSLSGNDISLSDFRGKNVMLVFPRGKVNDHWCQICHYQYVELTELEKIEKIQEKYNLQIIVILPYDRKTVEAWIQMIPDQLKIIDGWKNPAAPDKLSKGEKDWMYKTRKLFPKQFIIDSTQIPTPFPILIDADRELSMRLGIFTTFWDYSYVEQNISSIFMIDKNGILQFKYVGQNTFDRPEPQYLFRFIDRMMNN